MTSLISSGETRFRSRFRHSVGFAPGGSIALVPLDTTGSFTLVGDKLPGDAFATRFEAYEAISEPYEITVEFFTLDPSFRVNDCMRTKVCLVVADANARVRYFDGIVDRADFLHFTG